MKAITFQYGLCGGTKTILANDVSNVSVIVSKQTNALNQSIAVVTEEHRISALPEAI